MLSPSPFHVLRRHPQDLAHTDDALGVLDFAAATVSGMCPPGLRSAIASLACTGLRFEDGFGGTIGLELYQIGLDCVPRTGRVLGGNLRKAYHGSSPLPRLS